MHGQHYQITFTKVTYFSVPASFTLCTNGIISKEIQKLAFDYEHSTFIDDTGTFNSDSSSPDDKHNDLPMQKTGDRSTSSSVDPTPSRFSCHSAPPDEREPGGLAPPFGVAPQWCLLLIVGFYTLKSRIRIHSLIMFDTSRCINLQTLVSGVLPQT